jgi:hypothetical protein
MIKFLIAFPSAVIETAKQVWKDTRPKPVEPCVVCKGSGEILVPAMQIGSMIEYDTRKCHCVTKKL